MTRGTFKPNSNILIARGYGKRTDTPEYDRGTNISCEIISDPILRENTYPDGDTAFVHVMPA